MQCGDPADAFLRSRFPTVAIVDWYCEFRGSYYTNYCNQTYTIVQRYVSSWSILSAGGDLRSSDDMCRTYAYGNFNVTVNHLQHKKIPTNFFEVFPCINRLNISGLGITELDSDDFKEADDLLSVDLSSNRITTVKKWTFRPAEKLRTIDLSKNLISSIDVDAFEKQTNLSTLNLNDNLLRTVSTSMFNPRLVLRLQNNSLQQIECVSCVNGVSVAPSIRLIYLHDNKNLSTIPHLSAAGISISNTAVKNLSIPVEAVEIRADNCQIDTIVMPQTNKLKILILSQNRITNVDDFIQFSLLRVLNVSRNLIESIDDSFLTHLPYLELLDVSGNQLISFDQQVTSHPIVLQTLYLGENRLQSFQLNQRYEKLVELHLENNNLSVIDEDIRQKAPVLQTIQLHGNNYPCSHLSMSLLLLRFDGIIIKTIPAPAARSDSQWGYVKGIRCWNANNNSANDNNNSIDLTTTDAPAQKKTRIETSEINELKTALTDMVNGLSAQIEANMESKFKMLKKNLIDLIPTANNINKEAK